MPYHFDTVDGELDCAWIAGEPFFEARLEVFVLMTVKRINVRPDHEVVVNYIVIVITIIRDCPPPGAVVVVFIGQEILAEGRVVSAQVGVALQFLDGVGIGLAA